LIQYLSHEIGLTIKDPILEPYYIGKDKFNYTVFEIVPATLSGKGRRKKDAVVEFDPNGKTYGIVLTFFKIEFF
jgi:hypothetical protein